MLTNCQIEKFSVSLPPLFVYNSFLYSISSLSYKDSRQLSLSKMIKKLLNCILNIKIVFQVKKLNRVGSLCFNSAVF